MSVLSTSSSYSQKLREKYISRLGLFLQKNLGHKSTPNNRTKYEVSKIFQRISGHPFYKKYLGRHLTFTQDFVFFMAQIHNYMAAFRSNIPFEQFFSTGHFPLFLLKKFSHSKQKEMYDQLVDADKIQQCIQEQGFSGARKFLDTLLLSYEKSFSSKQLFRIHQILDLGASFQAFLQYDLTDLLLILYPPYLQDDTLALLSKEYRPIPSSNLMEELKSFLLYLSYLKKDAHYYLFFEHYGQFLGKKLIRRQEFENFFSQIREFLQDDILLNILRIQARDELFFIPPSPLPRQAARFSNIVDYVVTNSKEQQAIGRSAYTHQIEEALLTYLFDKLTIVRIQEQQKDIDSFLGKSSKEKSFTSLCVVLTAFGSKIYTTSIMPNIQFLLKHAVFLLSEFRSDLLYYSQVLTDAMKKSGDIFERIQKLLASTSKRNWNSIEVESRGVCQDFIAGAQGLLDLLSTIINVGKEDLKNNTQFVIPRDTMEKLLSNLQVSQALIEKVNKYVHTLTQLITVF